jgi:hypothetical protein
MMERIEVMGPDGTPVVVEVTDAALSTMGRAVAIDAAVAALAPTPTPRRKAQEMDA